MATALRQFATSFFPTLCLICLGMFAPLDQTCLRLVSPSEAFAQTDPFEIPLSNLTRKAPENVVRFEAQSVTKDSGVLKLVTRDGFKIYAKGFEVSLLPKGTSNLIPLSFGASPLPTKLMDPFYNEEREVFFSGAKISAALPETALVGTDSLVIKFEACSNSMCLLPTRFEIALLDGARSTVWKKDKVKDNDTAPVANLLSEGGAQGNQESRVGKDTDPFGGPSASDAVPEKILIPPANPNASDSLSQPTLAKRASYWVQSSLTQRSWFLFPALFLAGLMINLTPCVYPMIPITLNVLSQFGGGPGLSDEKKRRKRRVLPFVYVGGMVLAYTLMGVAAGMTGTIFGSLLQSTAVTVGLAILMFLLGLSMLGIFSMDKLQQYAARIPVAEKYPFAGVLTMGAVSGLISAPCTGPVLSTILLLIGQSKDPVYGFTLMFFFSLGFGSPYIALGLFTQRLGSLPKAGALLKGTKYLFSSLMFALALYYLKPLVSNWEFARPVYAEPHSLVISSVSLFLFVLFILGRSQPQLGKYLRLGTCLGLTAFALWLTLWLTSSFVALDNPSYSGASTGSGSFAESTSATSNVTNENNANANKEQKGVQWMKSWDQAVIRATVEKKPMIVDCWAQWCAACLKMDATIWLDQEVASVINEKFVALKLDFTNSSAFTDSLTEKWQIAGLPAVALFPKGASKEQEPPILFREAVEKNEILQALAKVLQEQ